jgi:type II secretory ATPase GspE/PulE/Tfp pilus assembly ATPase PilB-like protein
MPTAASIASLLEQALGAWPWRALPIAGAVLLAMVCLGQITILLIGRRKQPKEDVRVDFTHLSIQAALGELREKLAKLALGVRPNAVGIVEELMATAVALGASDIHLSPLSNGLSITIRVYGNLHAVSNLPSEASSLVCNRIKVLARLDLHLRSLPQDGRLVTQIGGRTVEARISTLPTEGGERIVLRLVEGGRSVPGLAALGFSTQASDGLAQLLSRPQGLLFVTGPVGSGKSTTLYAALTHIYQTRGATTTLVTLEDPIELKLPFAAQTQINSRAKMTFASGLRSALRQDPNVLMVGEIRDRETADIAMQASLTGHLLLTTVHADDSTGPFTRMIDMGIEPFLLANSVAGVLSQRLVRKLCPACRRLATPDVAIVARFRALGCDVDRTKCFEPAGCSLCENDGYAGRIPIAELLLVDASVRTELHEGCPAEVIRQRAVARGMTPLLADGLRLVELGETTLAEVLRVAG